MIGVLAFLGFGRAAAIPATAGGIALAFLAARVADEVRDRRRWSYVPVASRADAAARLREAGLPIRGATSAEVGGRQVDYLIVRRRDDEQAAALVGLPRESRRGRRRWKHARLAALHFSNRREVGRRRGSELD